MRRTIYVITLAALLSFLVGLWYELVRTGRSPLRSRKVITLNVLGPQNVLTQEFRTQLKNEENIDLQVTEIPTTKGLLNEILKNDTQYQMVIFPSYLSDSISYSEYFLPLGDVLGASELTSLVAEVSVDFLSLGKDPDTRYSLPLLWGVNGWLLPEGLQSDRVSLEDMALKNDAKSTLNMLPDPMEIYGVLTKIKPIVRTWVGTGNEDELKKELQGLQNRLKIFKPDSPPEGNLRQISSGRLEKSNQERFRLADEKSHLWIQFLAFRRGVPPPDRSLEVVKVLYSPRWSEKLVKTSRMAHCGRQLNNSQKVSENLKASFIRQLPISRLELISAHEAYEPLFMDYLKGLFPAEFAQ